MGKVWRAHHAAFKRDDALKVLPDHFVSDLEQLARYQREAQVLGSLKHPNIAQVDGLRDAPLRYRCIHAARNGGSILSAHLQLG